MSQQELRLACLDLAAGDIQKAEQFYRFIMFGPEVQTEGEPSDE